MKKLKFSTVGFENLQKELYQLSDEVLQHEAEIVQIDFINWINHHFILNENQFHFLISIDRRAICNMAHLASLAIANRLPISLNKLESFSDDEQGKIIWPTSNIIVVAGGENNYTVTGSLMINIGQKQPCIHHELHIYS